MLWRDLSQPSAYFNAEAPKPPTRRSLTRQIYAAPFVAYVRWWTAGSTDRRNPAVNDFLLPPASKREAGRPEAKLNCRKRKQFSRSVFISDGSETACWQRSRKGEQVPRLHSLDKRWGNGTRNTGARGKIAASSQCSGKAQ